MKLLSIRWRLSLMVLLLTLVVVTVLSVAAYIEFEESLLGNIDVTLRTMAEGVRVSLDSEQSRQRQDMELRAILGYEESRKRPRYRIWMEGSERDLFVSETTDDPFEYKLLHPPETKQPDVGEYSLFNIPEGRNLGGTNTFRTIWLRFVLDDHVANLVIARSCRYVYHELWEFLALLLTVGGSVALLMVLLAPMIVSHGLRAITDAGDTLGQITHIDLRAERELLPAVPIELEPFKSALQDMFSRLRKAMQQQEQLTADVAHELRTPLAVIKSTLQTMRIRPRTPAEYEEGIDDAVKDVDRMESLLSQILSLARLDAEQELCHVAEVRLDLLLESAADFFRPRVEQQGGRLDCSRGVAISIRGDESQLWQLFTNLLENAVRYGPQDGLINVSLEDGPDGQVTVRIHDEGGVIPPESLPHLFDRFYRVDSSRSQASGGSGLGLAIACEIVQRHQGDITITSDPQTGTTVTVRLPRQ